MSSTDSDIRTGAAKRGAGGRNADELANQIDAIRADLQNLTSTVGRIATGARSTARKTRRWRRPMRPRKPLDAILSRPWRSPLAWAFCLVS